jgi:hypothetical protein
MEGVQEIEGTKKGYGINRNLYMVRQTGIEPAQPCSHQPLKLARLPIPPLSQNESRENISFLPCFISRRSYCRGVKAFSYTN